LRLRVLVALGTAELTLLAVLGWIPAAHRFPWPGILLFGCAFAAYACAGALVAATRGPRPTARSTLGIVWLLAAAMRVVLVPLSPELSDDFNRYLWDGHVQLAGTNPFLYAPADSVLAPLRTEYHTDINNPTVPTIYPPLAQLAFLLVAATGSSLVLMKGLWLACDLATGWLLGRVARATGRDEATVLVLYLWAPLLIVEVAWSAHLEPLGLLPLVGAVWAATRVRAQPGDSGLPRPTDHPGQRNAPTLSAVSGALLALSALVKLAPAAALPALAQRKSVRTAPSMPSTVAAVGTFFLTVVILYAPYASAGSGLFTGLRTYGEHWWFMKGAFGLIEGLVQDPAMARRIVAVMVIGVIAGTTAAAFDLERTLLWVLGAGMILTPTLHPWYVLWMLPFAALRTSPPWIALGGLAFLGYFGLGSYQETGEWIQPATVRAALWIPFFLLLAEEGRRLLGRPAARDPGEALP
jgi:hypothetical protein